MAEEAVLSAALKEAGSDPNVALPLSRSEEVKGRLKAEIEYAKSIQIPTLVAQVHHRMPLIVDQDFKKSWMEESTPFPDLVKIMQPFPSHLMNMHEVVIEKKSKPAQSNLGF